MEGEAVSAFLRAREMLARAGMRWGDLASAPSCAPTPAPRQTPAAPTYDDEPPGDYIALARWLLLLGGSEITSWEATFLRSIIIEWTASTLTAKQKHTLDKIKKRVAKKANGRAA